MSDLNHIQARTTRRRSNRPFIILIILIIAIAAVIFFSCNKKNNSPVAVESSSSTVSDDANNTEASSEAIIITDENPTLTQAKLLEKQYDYDGAIELINSDSSLAENAEAQRLIASCSDAKEHLVRQDTEKITHVFFHTLIADTSKAFDGDSKEKGYNQMMTTIDEFNAILEEMYNRGFVLVSLHDIAHEVDDTENGGKKMVAGDIYLPEGKQAFVMSQDDVCYYEYMTGDGFASRLIVGSDGRPTCEMDLDDGTSVVGDFDLIPILDKFIDKHPDFSYKGAKAVIALTGYNGIFGYRTAASYSENPTYEEDKQKASEVASALKADGYEIASHSWGHRDLGSVDYTTFKTDCDKWMNEVYPLIGGTDIILFPFGSDVGGWEKYTTDNERFMYLWNEGFRYFCNVDSSQYWVQYGNDYFRQGRRNLDGYRMWRDITEPDNPRLSDLFDASKVFDKARPTPVAPMQ